MKGILTKTNRGWVVKQVVKEGPDAKLINQYPLVDNGHIDGLKLYDSNEGLEVEFEILTDYDNNGPEHFPKFARILTPEEAELKDWDKQKLVKKWESSGLLEGLKGESSNTDMVKLLKCKTTQLLDEPYISDDFQIDPDGAYEHTEYAQSTIVFKGEATLGRLAYIKLEDNKVIFDCSDEEYGPIVFDIELLRDALNKHIIII